jgi:hypothetical protein
VSLAPGQERVLLHTEVARDHLVVGPGQRASLSAPSKSVAEASSSDSDAPGLTLPERPRYMPTEQTSLSTKVALDTITSTSPSG